MIRRLIILLLIVGLIIILYKIYSENQINNCGAKETYSNHGDAHHGAAVEGYAKGRIQSFLSCHSGSGVGSNGDTHANETYECGTNGSDDVGNGRTRNSAVRSDLIENVDVDEHKQDNKDACDKDA